jgi:hypothetical protein
VNKIAAMAKFRILTMDGGGSWALIQAKTLLDIFGDISGYELLGKFSFVAANSGGSIVLAAMLDGQKLSDIVRMFECLAKRQQVFCALSWAAKYVGHPLSEAVAGGPRYDASKKLDGLRALLPTAGGLKLADARNAIANSSGQKPHFMITSFDYDRLRAIYFRSDGDSKTASTDDTYQTTLAEAVHGSSNAPIKYFDAPAEVQCAEDVRRCWDGGLAGLNNPVMAALTEVLGNGYQIDSSGLAAEIEILSIGTGTVRRPVQDGTIDPVLARKPLINASFTEDLGVVAGVILDDPPDAATFQAHTVLGGGMDRAPAIVKLPVVRLNPLIQPILSGDDWTRPAGLEPNADGDPFDSLVKLDMDAVDNKSVALIDLLIKSWMNGDSLNQPIRAGDNLQCEIGHPKYSDGKNDWNNRVSVDPNVVAIP